MKKLVQLQMLRAVAASLVVVCHALGYLVSEGQLDAGYSQPAMLLGWLGVSTFFVISGLIMIKTTPAAFGSLRAALTFAGRRIARVVPMYWFATIVASLIELRSGNPPRISDLVASLFFIPYSTPGVGVMLPIVGPGWTLNYEMFFYLLFSISILFSFRVGVSLLIACLCLMVVGSALFHPLIPYSGPTTRLAFYTDPLVLLFGVGVLIGVASRPLSSWRPRRPLAFSAILIGGCVFVFIAAAIRWPLQIGWQAVFAAACTGAVVLCASAASPTSTSVGRLLERAGDASYCTYLFHIFLISRAIKLWEAVPADIRQPWLFVILSLVVANAVGYLLHIGIERRVTRAAQRLIFPPYRFGLPAAAQG